MRTVFFGASALGHRCCRALLESGADVVGIVTMPEEFSISYSRRPIRNVTYRDFGDLALEFHLPLLKVQRGLDDATLATIASWGPDFGLAIGWYYMIQASARKLFPLGVAGIHASLLPRYRGGAPLVWAVINGEQTAGVTLFYLDDGVDTGDVIAEEAFSIADEDTIATLLEKATNASIRLVCEQLPALAAGGAARITQDDSAATTYAQRSPEDGLIDWTWPSERIRNFIRAQTRPYPGAFTRIAGKRVVIWDADVFDDGND